MGAMAWARGRGCVEGAPLRTQDRQPAARTHQTSARAAMRRVRWQYTRQTAMHRAGRSVHSITALHQGATSACLSRLLNPRVVSPVFLDRCCLRRLKASRCTSSRRIVPRWFRLRIVRLLQSVATCTKRRGTPAVHPTYTRRTIQSYAHAQEHPRDHTNTNLGLCRPMSVMSVTVGECRRRGAAP